ncbi:PEP-CTERM sorting domain-containing protein [Rubellicoccus peritrichatus]|uniref:PEP-CTERM sorting domain-containing protein n=1 Tax=Rubellicoccus peritrichatus TaxID=3080537 RepID=A0AAQ3L9K4_9BACT|nr:PEP-CTERM sorting domain-containing protein [Puniceicoccus sp. CR14]WOO41616.1 PEP-CTERM sorting domain-containing protein [Puniceicoccus sp. CR14]
MKMIKTITSTALLLCATSLAQATVVIQSYASNTGFDFDYGTWPGQLTLSTTGIEIAGTATNSGGGGNNLSPLDLTGESTLEITAQILPGNASSNFNVILFTTPGTTPGVSSGYQFSFADFNGASFTNVGLSLASPTFNGANGPADLSNITQIQIQGTFADTNAFALKVQSVQAVPEPANIALVLGTSFLGFVIFRRRILQR